MFETQSSRKRLLLATTGLGTVMTTMSFLGVMSPASASTLLVNGANTFARQLTSTGNATLSGTVVELKTAAATLTASNFITFALPSGMTFAANPTVGFSAGGTTLNLSLSTGGSGSQSAVYQVTSASSGNSLSISLSGLQVSGLQTYVSSNSTAASFNLTATLTADPVTGQGGTGGTLVANISDAASATQTVGAAQTIDVASGGTRFVSGTGTALFAPLGVVTFGNSAIAPNDVGGSSPVSMSAQGGSITVSGSLTGLSTVYAIATAVATTCATAAPSGAFTATPGASTATLTGLSVSAFQVCAIANGSSVLSNSTITVRGVVTTSNNSTVTGTTTSNAVGYSGTVRTSSYFVGVTGGYSSFAYAVNSGTTASTALVSVRRSDGATAIGSLTSLAAGASALYGASDINTAVGSTFLGDSSSRAQVTFLFGSSSVKMTGLLLNPAGVVTQMGTTFSD